MTRMALDILRRRGVDVLVYGAGTSLDNHHILALPAVQHVAVGDIVGERTDMEYHDLNQPATRRFDIVIASEVIEHFRDPIANFERLFQFVARDGLLVCGTSLRGPGRLAGQRYLFYRDHTSLYSPESLPQIAARFGHHVDFRPLAGFGARKRYVFFARSRGVMDDVIRYFGWTPYAPSELTLSGSADVRST